MFGNLFLKRLGYKRIRIKGATFIIKKLTPVDFLDSEGVPFTVFKVDTPMTIYGQVLGKIKTKDEEKKEETEKAKLIKQIVKAGVIKYPDGLDAADMIKSEFLEMGITVYEKILTFSLSVFVRPYAIKRDQLIFWDFMAKRYGKLPIDCLIPKSIYTPVDAFIFNSFVMQAAAEHEAALAKKQLSEVKRRK